MVTLPWKKANAQERVVEQLIKLVQAYAKLPNASKNQVARHLPSFFTENVALRKKRITERNNAALLERKYGASLNNYRRLRQRSNSSLKSLGARSNASVNSLSNTRSNLPNMFVKPNNYRKPRGPPNLSQTRYSLRSTNNRIVH